MNFNRQPNPQGCLPYPAFHYTHRNMAPSQFAPNVAIAPGSTLPMLTTNSANPANHMSCDAFQVEKSLQSLGCSSTLPMLTTHAANPSQSSQSLSADDKKRFLDVCVAHNKLKERLHAKDLQLVHESKKTEEYKIEAQIAKGKLSAIETVLYSPHSEKDVAIKEILKIQSIPELFALTNSIYTNWINNQFPNSNSSSSIASSSVPTAATETNPSISGQPVAETFIETETPSVSSMRNASISYLNAKKDLLCDDAFSELPNASVESPYKAPSVADINILHSQTINDRASLSSVGKAGGPNRNAEVRHLGNSGKIVAAITIGNESKPPIVEKNVNKNKASVGNEKKAKTPVVPKRNVAKTPVSNAATVPTANSENTVILPIENSAKAPTVPITYSAKTFIAPKGNSTKTPAISTINAATGLPKQNSAKNSLVQLNSTKNSVERSNVSIKMAPSTLNDITGPSLAILEVGTSNTSATALPSSCTEKMPMKVSPTNNLERIAVPLNDKRIANNVIVASLEMVGNKVTQAEVNHPKNIGGFDAKNDTHMSAVGNIEQSSTAPTDIKTQANESKMPSVTASLNIKTAAILPFVSKILNTESVPGDIAVPLKQSGINAPHTQSGVPTECINLISPVFQSSKPDLSVFSVPDPKPASSSSNKSGCNDLILARKVINHYWPGSFIHLNKIKKERFINATKTFLKSALTPQLYKELEIDEQSAATLMMPESLNDEYYDWMLERLDEGLMDDDKSRIISESETKKRKSVNYQEDSSDTSPKKVKHNSASSSTSGNRKKTEPMLAVSNDNKMKAGSSTAKKAKVDLSGGQCEGDDSVSASSKKAKKVPMKSTLSDNVDEISIYQGPKSWLKRKSDLLDTVAYDKDELAFVSSDKGLKKMQDTQNVEKSGIDTHDENCDETNKSTNNLAITTPRSVNTFKPPARNSASSFNNPVLDKLLEFPPDHVWTFMRFTDFIPKLIPSFSTFDDRLKKNIKKAIRKLLCLLIGEEHFARWIDLTGTRTYRIPHELEQVLLPVCIRDMKLQFSYLDFTE